MGKSFGEVNGQAKKSGMEYIKLELGENKMRMVGELLPRYAYWKKLRDAGIPLECLSFDREQERFTNIEKDWFKHYFPDQKCSWSYIIQVIDLKDNKLKLCGLKKKLFDQIQDLAKDLGDPTNVETGFDIIFTKKSTGPNKFNIEYKLKERAIETRALTVEELELIKDLKSIDEIIPRPIAAEQKAFIEQAWINRESEEINTDTKATAEFDDDIPY